jgi:hypothetical protein
MKQILAILLWCLLGTQWSLAQQNCTKDGNNQRCETVLSSVASGEGKAWGPWYTLTSSAPKGLTYKWAEGHIDAPTNGENHRCGVRGVGTNEPSPIANDGPTKGYRSGTSYWAMCYIAEQDANHVVLRVQLQGVEGMKALIYGTARLLVVYGP